MKLGALLMAGKSLALGRNRESPYRADRQVYLPKFGSEKNPFTAPAEAGPADSAGETAVAAPTKTEAAAKTQKLPPLPVAVSGQVAVAEGHPVSKVREERRSLNWVSKLNPFGMRKAPPVPVLKNGKVPMQAELSLDAVKVLRNDLSDVDIEVVPLKSRPAREAVPTLEPAKKSWELLGERLFKMETT